MSKSQYKNEIDTRRRALIYVRVSTDKQADKGIAIPTQIALCMAKIEALGLVCDAEHDIYRDEGLTGTEMSKRKGLLSLLNRCKQDKNIKAVVTYELSRLSRSQHDSSYIRYELKKKAISIVSATEHITDDPMGDAMAGILAVVNQLSSEQTRQRVADNMMNKAMRGDFPGRAPFGYINKQEKASTGRVRAWIEVQSDDAEWVVKTFEYYATGSYSLDSLVIKLQKDGFPEHKLPGGKLSKGFLGKMLRNVFYNCRIQWAKYEGKGNQDRVVSEALFLQVQQMLDIQNRGADRSRKHESFMKSVCLCGECGSRMTLDKQRTTANNDLTYLRCTKKQKNKKVECSQGYGYESDYIKEVGAILKQIQIPERVVTKVKGRIKELFADEDALNQATHDTITKQLEKLKTKKRNLVHMLLEKDNPTETDRSLYEETRMEIDSEEIRLVGDLEKSQSRMSDMMRLVDLSLALAGNVHTAFMKTKDDQLRGLLTRTLFTKIELKDKKVSKFSLQEPLAYLVSSELKKSSVLVPFEQDIVCGP